jgi:hypothetical protein
MPVNAGSGENVPGFDCEPSANDLALCGAEAPLPTYQVGSSDDYRDKHYDDEQPARPP